VTESTERGRRATLARALDPGVIVNAFVLEVALDARDPDWRDRDRYSSPLPPAAVRALEFVAELGI
jgi:hypothetical protein